MKTKEKHKPMEEVMEADDKDTCEEKDQSEPAIAQDGKEAEQQIQDALAKQEEYLALAQRVKAEFDNYRRRNEGLRTQSLEEGRNEVIASMLPVLDNFERALAAMKADDGTDGMYEGVEKIYRQFYEVLQKLGLEEIQSLGAAFDPQLHDAVMQSPADEAHPEGTVTDVMQKGYCVDQKVIRYAMVAVAV